MPWTISVRAALISPTCANLGEIGPFLIGIVRGVGKVVSVLAFYSDDLSSNPAGY